MIAAFTLHGIAQISAGRIVDCLVEGTAIALFTGLILRLSPRQSSGLRFTVWFSSLLAIAALPWLSFATFWYRSDVPAALGKPALILPGWWASYMFGAWAAIAAWGLMRVGIGLWHMCSLRRSAVEIDPIVIGEFAQATLEKHGGGRRVVLCTSDRVQVPTAIGLIAPAVIVPRWILEELSPEDLQQVLLHELAHLRRRDDWTNLAQQVIKALFFFHPIVWWISQKISLEREMACDDAVLRETAKPRAYAECLAALAQKTLARRSLALAQAMWGRVRQTSLRVAQILDASRALSTTHSWKVTVPVAAGLVIASAVMATEEPRLIGFQDAQPTVARLAVHSVDSDAIRPTNVVLRDTGIRPQRPAGIMRTPAVATRNKRLTTPKKSIRQENAEGVLAMARSKREPSLVHQTASIENALVSTEAVFVVVEGHENSRSPQPVYEIRMWRVTVWHPRAASTTQEIPRKET